MSDGTVLRANVYYPTDPATGSLRGDRLGLVKLGMTGKRARALFVKSSTRRPPVHGLLLPQGNA
jgi:hypothetical protein